MPNPDELKRAAAEAAMTLLPPSGVIGLGTGSTALHAIRLIGERVAADRSAGGAARLTGVATSRATELAAVEAGIPLASEAGPWDIAVTFDGADEVSPALDVIKGGGGALLREKIVNHATALNVIMVDISKLVPMLGHRFRLPVEIVIFGWQQTRRAVEAVAGPAVLRERDGGPFVTDNGNYILDVETGPITGPADLEAALETVPGVVVTGLFVGRTDVVVVAGPDGVEVRRRPSDPAGGGGSPTFPS
jgi:ribose 5-phosphate isomerase A